MDFLFWLSTHPKKKIVARKNTILKISSENLLARRLKEWLESENLLKNPFKIVRLFIFTESFTMVPEEYFEDKGHQELTSVIFQENAGNKIIENKIESLNARLIFPVLSEIIEVLHFFFNENPEIIHPFAKLLHAPVKSKKINSAVIISTRKYFFLTVTRNNKLLLANSFQTAHQNDLVYNVLNTFQQLETARSETELFIANGIFDSAEIIGLLQPYFENISLLKTDEMTLNPEITANQLLLYLTLI